MAIKHNTIIQGLRKSMERDVENAYKNHEFRNLTFNTQDSYGGAVYFKGKMHGTPYFLEQKAECGTKSIQMKTDGQFGHEKALEYLLSCHPKEEYTYRVTTGTEYSKFLERERNLDVLTGAFNDAKERKLSEFKLIK